MHSQFRNRIHTNTRHWHTHRKYTNGKQLILTYQNMMNTKMRIDISSHVFAQALNPIERDRVIFPPTGEFWMHNFPRTPAIEFYANLSLFSNDSTYFSEIISQPSSQSLFAQNKQGNFLFTSSRNQVKYRNELASGARLWFIYKKKIITNALQGRQSVTQSVAH